MVFKNCLNHDLIEGLLVAKICDIVLTSLPYIIYAYIILLQNTIVF